MAGTSMPMAGASMPMAGTSMPTSSMATTGGRVARTSPSPRRRRAETPRGRSGWQKDGPVVGGAEILLDVPDHVPLRRHPVIS
jgi:hypothetical protein